MVEQPQMRTFRAINRNNQAIEAVNLSNFRTAQADPSASVVAGSLLSNLLSNLEMPVNVGVDINIDGNEAIEQILNSFRYQKNFNSLIINRTNEKLRRVGAFNQVGQWPFIDVEPKTVASRDFEGGTGGDAAMAANYKIGNAYFQFAISYPYLQFIPIPGFEEAAIGLGKTQESDNEPAESVFNNTHTAGDKTLTRPDYEVRALMTQEGNGDNNKLIWVFEVYYAQ